MYLKIFCIRKTPTAKKNETATPSQTNNSREVWGVKFDMVGRNSTINLTTMMMNPALINIQETLYLVTRVSLIETPAANAVVGKEISLGNMIYIVDVMADSIIRNEVPFCELDSHAGDGDFGMSIAKVFKQLKREWQSIVTGKDLDIGIFLNACSLIIM